MRKRRTNTCRFVVILTLLPLLFFKYANFFNTSLEDAFGFLGIRMELPGLNWFIPVGISFITFQALGYVFDVSRRVIPAEHVFIDHALFLSFFPQVVSGPISKAAELVPQFNKGKRFNYEDGIQGAKMILWGMVFKFVVADRLGLFVDTIFGAPDRYSGAVCLLGAFFYSIQIYADFAGYSWMAIGVARLLDIKLIDNFRRPYFSYSITDFWKRWHISLSRWLKDYVYIPLGGNRCSKPRTYLNIILTFLVSGLWHGAAWTFILWGLLHGFAQVVEKSFGWQKPKEDASRFSSMVRVVFTFCLVSIAWVLFRSPSIPFFHHFLSHIVSDFGRLSLPGVGGAMVVMWFIGILVLTSKDFYDEFFQDKYHPKSAIQFIVYSMLFCLVLGLGVLDGGQFIYGLF